MKQRRGSIVLAAAAICAAFILPMAARAVEPDDDIPGTWVPGGPVSDYLGNADLSDVYALHLYGGQRFEATLTAATETDFRLHLFSPEATSIVASEPVAVTTGSVYPRTLAYSVPAGDGGTHYLAAVRVAGEGQYSASLWRGPALVFSDDPLVSDIRMDVGSRLQLNGLLRISNGGDGELRWTVRSNRRWLTVTPVAGIGERTLAEIISTVGLGLGIHDGRLTATAVGAGNSLSYSYTRLRVYQPTCVKLSAPGSIPYGARFRLLAVSRLGKYGRASDRPDRYATVRFSRRELGSADWTQFATARTNYLGRAALVVSQASHRQYRVRRVARGYYRGDNSNTRTVYTRYRVTLAINGTNVPWNRLLTARYTCYPAPTLDAPWCYFQVYKGGRWRTDFKDLLWPSASSWYPLVWERPGTYKFWVYVPASNGYWAGYSPVRTVRWHW